MHGKNAFELLLFIENAIIRQIRVLCINGFILEACHMHGKLDNFSTRKCQNLPLTEMYVYHFGIYYIKLQCPFVNVSACVSVPIFFYLARIYGSLFC